MPTPVKSLDNMSKHLTKAEIEARSDQESASLPSRKPKAPKGFQAGTPQRKIWNRVLEDMAGYDILDRLDTDALEIYCLQLVRLQNMRGLLDDAVGYKDTVELSREIRGLEATILSYASKLGLTPESRVRFAKQRAEQEEYDPDADLFA